MTRSIEHAIWTRPREGISDLTGLVQHHYRGSQYTSIAYTERLAAAGIDASAGRVGDSYDNAVAETINGLYKTELIKPRGPWRTIDQVEVSTLEWVDWFNHRRINRLLRRHAPAEYEALYYSQHRTQKVAEFSNP